MSLKVKCFTVIFLILIVSCSERKEYSYTDLATIVQKGDLKELNEILRYTDVNVTDSLGNTILMFAVQNAKVQMVKKLLQLRADPNMINNKELSALDISRNNKTEEISELIKEFQFADWKKHDNKFTEEFFEYGINNDNDKIVKEFLLNGRSVDSSTISNGLSPIINAMLANSQKVTLLLLDNDTNPNHSFDTRPIITIAAMFNQYEVVKKIIEKGGDVNALDGPLTSALMFAAEEGNIDIVKLLITNGADASLLDRKNETALDKAKAKKRNNVVAFLSGNK